MSLTLTSVSETDVSIQDILRQCTSLKNLVLDPSDFDEDFVQTETPVSFPQLTSLVFGSTQWSYKGAPDIETAGLLKSLYVPALTDLSVFGSDVALLEAALCIEASSPPIVSLDLQEHLVDVSQPPQGFEHIVSILETVPVLQKLHLHLC